MKANRSLQFYIDGQWVDPVLPNLHSVIDPATEMPIGQISLGSPADVDRAVAAARRAFADYGATPPAERRSLMQRVLASFERRADELADAVSHEMGAPLLLSKFGHVYAGRAHLAAMIDAMTSYSFVGQIGSAAILKEPIGVCALITPWNWPINQVAAKVVPALAAGCTMVLKPSEVSPLSAHIFAEIIDEAGMPPGVFNLVHGTGDEVGGALAAHPDVDMVSFTGSTRAGVLVAKAAAESVKRVTQELGGKSANLVLDDADFAAAVTAGVSAMMLNSGQSCNAPSRLLIPAGRRDEAIALAKAVCSAVVPGSPFTETTTMGPVANATQWTKIQRLIQAGMDEGATLVSGGPGRPEGLMQGYFVRPTVFIDVTNDMTIARQEIFGPVLAILVYQDEEEAIKLANDTPYGLAAYVQSGDPARARRVAGRLRAGNVYVNGANPDINVPFGGYKQSGNGREWGIAGLEEYLETKAVLGA
jgi:aldehyde dehydrogenase (NAD+)